MPFHTRCLLNRNRGVSLLEFCVALAVVMILLSQAVPALSELRQRSRLQGLAQTVLTDLQYARSAAVHTGAAVHFRLSQHAEGSCYLLHTGASAACTCEGDGVALCKDGAAVLKSHWLPVSSKLSMKANVGSISFQSRQGLATSTARIDLSLPGGPTIQHVVSIAGRIRSCAIDGAISGLPRC